MSKTDRIRSLAIEAGLPDTIQVTYHRHARRWYLHYPLPLGPSAVLGQATTIIASYTSIEDAQNQLPGDTATFFATYRRILVVVGGEIDRLTPAEAALLITAHRSGGISMPFDPSYRQLIDEGAVQTMPQLGTKALLYRLTSLGQHLLEAHYDALNRRSSEDV